MDDASDFLSDSLFTLYDYTPITHSSAGSTFRYVNNDTEIILQTPDTKPGNWSLHASSIWVSSLYISDHIHLLRLEDKNEARVLELGAGAGCPGILIAKLYPRVHVTLSDYPDEGLISSLERNVANNSARATVAPYVWGSKVVGDLADRFDVIIAADTLWNVDSHSHFVDSLEMLLDKGRRARVYLVAGLHTGRYTIQAFHNLIITRGLFEVEEFVERRVRDDGNVRAWQVERDEEDEKERRDWVVWIVLKWKTIA